MFREIEKKQATWLVTGAAGFIGSHLVEKLLSLNQKVIGLDNFSTGHKRNVVPFKENSRFQAHYEFVEGDVCERKLCQSLTKKVDFVLHQAALGSVPRSIAEPLESHRSNVDGFIEILKASTENKVKKIVFASSSSIYGDHPRLPKIESEIGSPLSPYAATKLIDEIYASVFHKVYKTPVVGLRYFNVFGPRQDPNGPYAAVIPLWISSMVAGQPVFINGDGKYSRDFCFVDNVVQANLLAAQSRDLTSGQFYNIAYGEQTNLLELYALIKKSLSELNPQLQISDVKHRDSREGDIPHSLADISKAQRDLGYSPQVRVGEGISKTVKSFYQIREE